MQIVFFSIILIVDLQWPMIKAAVILGAILVIAGSAGPVAVFFLSIQDGAFGYDALGVSLVLIGVVF